MNKARPVVGREADESIRGFLLLLARCSRVSPCRHLLALVVVLESLLGLPQSSCLLLQGSDEDYCHGDCVGLGEPPLFVRLADQCGRLQVGHQLCVGVGEFMCVYRCVCACMCVCNGVLFLYTEHHRCVKLTFSRSTLFRFIRSLSFWFFCNLESTVNSLY